MAKYPKLWLLGILQNLDGTSGYTTVMPQNLFLYLEKLGKYLGTSKNFGSNMSMWILKQNGEIVSRTALRTLNDSELASDTENTKR